MAKSKDEIESMMNGVDIKSPEKRISIEMVDGKFLLDCSCEMNSKGGHSHYESGKKIFNDTESLSEFIEEYFGEKD